MQSFAVSTEPKAHSSDKLSQCLTFFKKRAHRCKSWHTMV